MLVRARPSPVKEIGLTSQADPRSVIRTMRYSIARIGFLMRVLFPLLPSLRSPRSVLLRLRPLQAKGAGGAEEARTPDPLLAKEVLSQLSYGPLVSRETWSVVGHGGLEPPASVLSGPRSNQLS